MNLIQPPPLLAVFLSAAFLLASALSIPAGPAYAGGGKSQNKEATKTVLEQCQENFGTSPASDTCESKQFVEYANGDCQIKASCKIHPERTPSRMNEDTITLSDPADASNLKNCGGYLRLSC